MAETLDKAIPPAPPAHGRVPRSQPPEDPVPLRRGRPATTAGGVAAVVSSLRHAFGKAGPVRGTRLLLRLNQVDGYDCPGCAWPEPDGRRSAFEFCENGAKAAAEEGTSARATPELFARYSVAELSRNSDHWLRQQGPPPDPLALLPGRTHSH